MAFDLDAGKMFSTLSYLTPNFEITIVHKGDEKYYIISLITSLLCHRRTLERDAQSVDPS